MRFNPDRHLRVYLSGGKVRLELGLYVYGLKLFMGLRKRRESSATMLPKFREFWALLEPLHLDELT